MDNEDVHALTDSEFRTWIFCLLATKANGGFLPPNKTIAFKLRRKEQAISDHITAMLDAGLLINVGNELQPTGWKKLQFQSDVSTDRVKRFRNGKRNGDETFPRRFRNGDETFPKRPQSTEYRVQSTDTPKPSSLPSPNLTESDPGFWVEKFVELHPSPCDPRYPLAFAEDNMYRLGDTGQYEKFMGAVWLGLVAWSSHWALDGNRFAKPLDKWLAAGGWKKNPPAIVHRGATQDRFDPNSLTEFE